jgi:hypothetical protein
MRAPSGIAAGSAPVLLALLFAVWCGNLWYGAAAMPAIVGYALVLASGAVLLAVRRGGASGGARWLADPWRLGFPGLLLPWALLAAAGLALWASPVARAGRVGVVLLPAWLLLPAAAARCWRSEAARRWGARAAALGLAGVAGTALGYWLLGITARPSLPVGQHLHLTAWIVLALPLAALGLREGREGGAWRLVAALAVALGVAAILGTQTLSGLLALGVEAVLAIRWGLAGMLSGRLRTAFAAAAVLALVAMGGAEIRAVVRGTDPSGAARFVYWRAGWEGLLERPVVGSGPGSTAWTLPLLLRPEPGVNPPGEVVGELHLLPLTVAYELGLPGALLTAVVAGHFVARRRRERDGRDGRGPAADPGFVAAGLAALTGGAAAGLATGDWRVTALPMAAAVAAGAALAGGRADVDSGPEVREARRAAWLAPALWGAYVLAAALALAPLARAHAAYDRSLAAEADGLDRLDSLDRAVDLDPGFPLYRARRAWLRGDAAEAMAAAEAARGVPAFWLAAGAAAEAAGEGWAAALAYERACSADPLGAFAPLGLARVGSPLHEPVSVAARALAAEPRLAAAVWWRGREALLEQAALRAATADGIDEGWRQALREGVEAMELASPNGPSGQTTEADLALTLDGAPEASLSLHAFRRRSWPARVAQVRVDTRAAAAFTDLPPAVSQESTDPRLFPPTCTGAFTARNVGATPYRLR